MTKPEIIKALKEKELEVDETMSVKELETILKNSESFSPKFEETKTPDSVVITKKGPEGEPMVSMSDVKKLIAEAVAGLKQNDQPKKLKKITEYFAHVWRLRGKWVVDFKDRNTRINEETGEEEKIDVYIKNKIHAYNKYNAEKKEFEAWVTVVFQDGTTEDIALPKYVEHRVLVYCPIIKRHKTDLTYSIGLVEIKEENKEGKLVGTGVMRDQDVEMCSEVFEVKTPDGEILMLPDYVIA